MPHILQNAVSVINLQRSYNRVMMRLDDKKKNRFMKQSKTTRRRQTNRTAVRGQRLAPSRKTPKLTARKRIRAARPLHKRILLHPASVLLVLCAGVLIIGWTFKVVAGSYTVKAKVPAAPLVDGAVITAPDDGATVTVAAQTVHGTCPADSYVKLFDNNTFSGVAWCNSGQFSIQMNCYDGTNVLRAQDYNETDDPGPTTPVITIKYTPPSPPPTQPSQPGKTVTGTTGSPVTVQSPNGTSYTISGSGATEPPLLLTADFHYQTFLTGSQFKWSLDLEGGVPPYTVYISWGDGQHSKLIFKVDPVFWIQHVYNRNGYYPITIRSVDAEGSVRIIQLAALIKSPGATSIYGIVGASTGSSNGSAQPNGIWSFFAQRGSWLWLAWPAYATVVLMVLSFWLGERESYLRFVPKRRSAKSRKLTHRSR